MKTHGIIILLIISLAVSLFIAALLTLPVIGFVYGFTSEGIERTFGNGLGAFSWRIISGIFCAILVLFEGGRMALNEGGTAYADLRHQIIPTFVFLSTLIYVTTLFVIGIVYFIRQIKARRNVNTD